MARPALKKITALPILIFVLALFSSKGQEYNFRHLTVEDGLPSNKSWCVMKDSRGFIWIGTEGGLCRYDGFDIRIFQYDPQDSSSLSDNGITTSKQLILEDLTGTIWIGTINGLNRFNAVNETFKRYHSGSEKPGNLSNSHIRCLFLDSAGQLWVGTKKGLNKYQSGTDDFKIFFPNTFNSSSEENNIISIYQQKPGWLLIGTVVGLFLFDLESGKFYPVKPHDINSDCPDTFQVLKITEDNDGIILVGTTAGIFSLCDKSMSLIPTIPINNSKSGLFWLDIAPAPNDKNTIWVTDGKLYSLNRQTGQYKYFLPDPQDPGSILGQVTYSLYFDDAGIFWVTTTRGVNFSDPEMDQISRHSEFARKFNSDAAYFAKDSRNHLWISTAQNELIHFDENNNLIKYYPTVAIEPVTKRPEITILFVDIEDNLWIGTLNYGLLIIENNKSELFKCELFEGNDFGKPLRINDIYQDSEGTIWMATTYGLNYLKKNDPPTSLKNYKLNLDDAPFCIYEDRYGWFWIGSYAHGLYCQPPEFKSSGTFLNFDHDPLDDHSLSNNQVQVIEEDSDGNLWIATVNGLNRFNRSDSTFEQYITGNEKGANCIWDMESDKRGYLWMTTESGLVRGKYNADATNYQDLFRIKRILPFRNIYLRNIDNTPDGKFYLGAADFTKNGYYSFHPDSIPENQRIPPVYITEFLVKNDIFDLDSSILFKKHITLKYHQNFFSFRFSALDYSHAEKNEFAYYLEGLEKGWNYSGARRMATYTDVEPGQYIFHAKGSNNDGYWNEEGVTVMLTIYPPFWKTWWAYTIYGLCLVLLIYLWYQYERNRLRLKQRLAIEHLESEKLKELDSLKSDFFANISHEFRTPLTLILGPLKNLMESVNDPSVKQELTILQRSALRLQRLINQILELARLESGKMELNTEVENLTDLVKNYTHQFESLARQKNINLVFQAESATIMAAVDREKMEVILYNLISNALKFTNAGGRVGVEVSTHKQLTISPQITGTQLLKEKFLNDCVTIVITDTGPGIPTQHLSHIFDRFYQVNESRTKVHKGSGIGLALTRELVELHHGSILTESKVGVGSKFVIILPLYHDKITANNQSRYGIKKSKPALKRDHLQVDYGLMTETHDLEIPGYPNPPSSLIANKTTAESRNENIPILLIVEDNPDLQLYIRGILERQYAIKEALDGQKGYDLAVQVIPDLILTDVMMPGINGFELARKLKSDERTSHIPIILLTALASIESRIEGFETGVDDFITKPFDPLELKTRIKNLIVQRKKLQARFLKNLSKLGLEPLMDLDTADLSSSDQRFLKKIINFVHQNIADPDLNIEQLSSELSVSVRQLQRKMSALTGNSPGRFIRTIRLNRAAKLLAEKTGTVSEIAFEVGFNNLSYFTKSFKEQFGILPSQYSA